MNRSWHDFRSLHGAGSWILTALVAGLLVSGAFWWRQSPVRSEPLEILPRTRALIVQKTGSLEAYNKPIAEAELLRFYQNHLHDRPILGEAFAVLSDVVVGRLLPLLWQESQKKDPFSQFISHRTMAGTIHEHFPQKLLANGDVVLFPNDHDLRVVVSEPPQDFFRDTGWHWRWIGFYLDRLSPDQLGQHKELDIYAAEELSEFLSVFGVGLMMLADRLNEGETPIDSYSVSAAFTMIAERPKSAHSEREQPEVAYSHATKLKLIESLPQPMFREVTHQMKVKFEHRPNKHFARRRTELVIPFGQDGGGVASEDFDGDGDCDLYFAGDGAGRLYENVEGREFRDVTAKAGLKQQGESRAGYFVDYDNDGDLDLFITFVWSTNRLYRNDGGGRFHDVTDQSGLNSGKDITHEAVWFDMNNDGLLDVYTANFGNWVEGAVPTIGRWNVNGGPNRLYRHRLDNGKHFFEEVGESFGVADRSWTICVGAWDFDGDGFMDLCSLNDFGTSRVFRNVKGEHFVDASRVLRLDALYNAMNFTLLDLDHSGEPAIYVSEITKLVHRQRYRKPTEQTPVVFSAENMRLLRALVMNQLYRKNKDGTYEDVHSLFIEPADLGWAWDASAMDYENDGDLELLVLNGTERDIPRRDDEQRQDFLGQRTFLSQFDHERNVFFVSQDGYFYDMSERCELAYAGNSRGSTFFDFDGDGDLDVAINDYTGPAKVFENLQNSGNNWIRFKLTGSRSNRDAIGAKIEVQFGDQIRFDQVVSGSGYLSQNPHALHFGLGQAQRVDKVRVTWPSGASQLLTEGFSANGLHLIEEPVMD